ncbi:MAG: SCP2 sterol-binding domain-containing protein [Thermoplasmata archaeon]|nr:SCP2 sterol-binding domain-containing protein [Thermoplasmata archaeon]
MARFPSAEWAQLLREAINASEEYALAAKAWEGDVLLRIVPDATGSASPGIHLDLAGGACRAARFVPDSGATESEFVFEATAPVWDQILRGEVDPVRAVLSGQVKIRGNVAKAMRFTKASTLLVRIASAIPNGP